MRVRSILANLVPRALLPGFGSGAQVVSWHCKLKGHPCLLPLALSGRPNFLALSKKKKKRKEKKRKGKRNDEFNLFITLINSFNLKDQHYNNISRHKRFGGIYLFAMKSTIILSAILRLVRFGDHVLFSGESGGRKKERDARERLAYLVTRTFFIAPYFEAPATQLYVSLFSSSTIGNPRSYL